MKGYSMQERLKNRGNQLVRLWKRQPLFSTAMALLLMVVVQTIALGFDYPSFGEWLVAWGRNWINILRNNAGVGIVALGMTFVIISGGIDLAVGSTLVAVGAVVMALIDEGPYGLLRQIGISGVPAYAIAILTALLMGTALGAGMARLFIPYYQIGTAATGGIPPYLVEIAWSALYRVYALLGVLFVAALGTLVWALRRMRLFQVIKMGGGA